MGLCYSRGHGGLIPPESYLLPEGHARRLEINQIVGDGEGDREARSGVLEPLALSTSVSMA